MSEWFPIASAPREQVEVLLFARSEKPPVFAGMFIGSEWCRASSGNYSPRDDFFGDRKFHPSHWMPLPAPPEE